MGTLHRRCAWCGKDLGGPATAPDTAGVCPPCKKSLIPAFLDTLPGATLLVGEGARVKSANSAALGQVGKPLPEIEERPLGDVLGCPHARRGGGHDPYDCATCSIRAPIEDTLRTGTPHEGVPAFLRLPTGYVPLFITTRRVKEGVLLRLDRPA